MFFYGLGLLILIEHLILTLMYGNIVFYKIINDEYYYYL